MKFVSSAEAVVKNALALTIGISNESRGGEVIRVAVASQQRQPYPTNDARQHKQFTHPHEKMLCFCCSGYGDVNNK